LEENSRGASKFARKNKSCLARAMSKQNGGGGKDVEGYHKENWGANRVTQSFRGGGKGHRGRGVEEKGGGRRVDIKEFRRIYGFQIKATGGGEIDSKFVQERTRGGGQRERRSFGGVSLEGGGAIVKKKGKLKGFETIEETTKKGKRSY